MKYFPLVPIVLVLLLVISPIVSSMSVGNKNILDILNNSYDIDNALKVVANALGIDINTPEDYYNVFLSGRALRIKTSEFPFLKGLNPRNIAFGAFDKYSGWVLLPTRIYDRTFEDNDSKTFVIPEKINERTIIEIKLPTNVPIKVNVSRNPPGFARGASWYRELMLTDREHGLTIGYLYVFYDNPNGPMGWRVRDYLIDYTIDYKNVHETFEAIFPPRIIRLLEVRNYDLTIVRKVYERAISEPIVANVDVSVKPLGSWGPVPDGGGGGDTEGYVFNMVEFRIQPTKEMLEKDVEISKSKNCYEFDLYITDPEEDIGPFWWNKILLSITAYKISGDDEYPTMLVYMGDSTSPLAEYVLSPELPNIVLAEHIDPYGSTSEKIHVKIVFNNIENSVWGLRIIPTVYAYWPYLENSPLKRMDDFKISSSTLHLVVDSEGSYQAFYLQLPSAILNTVDPTNTIKLRATIGVIPNNIPEGARLSVRMLLNGISSNKVTIEHSDSTNVQEYSLELSLTESTLLRLASKEEPVEIGFEVTPLELPEGLDIFILDLTLEFETSLYLTERPQVLSQNLYPQGYILYTGIFRDYSEMFYASDINPIIGRSVYLLMTHIGPDPSYTNTIMQTTISRLKAVTKFSYCDTIYRTVVSVFGPDIAFGGDAKLQFVGLKRIKLNIRFPRESTINDVIVHAIKQGDLEEDISKVLYRVSSALSSMSFLLSFFNPSLGALTDVASWSSRLVAEGVLDQYSYQVDPEDKIVTVEWSSWDPEQITIEVKVETSEDLISDGSYYVYVLGTAETPYGSIPIDYKGVFYKISGG